MNPLKKYMKFLKYDRYFFNKLRLYSQLIFYSNFKSTKALPPKTITIDFTWSCNLNCIMCPRRKFKVSKNKNMTFEEIKTIIKKIPSVQRVNLLGLGEPLMHPDFFNILNFLEKKKILVVFTTNGTLMTEKNIKKLTKNIETVCFSLDSPEPDKYKSIRGVELNDVVKNIKLLRKLRKDVNINLQAVILSNTIRGLHKLVDIAKEVKASISLLNPLIFNKNEEYLHPHHLEDCEQLLKKIDNYAKKHSVVLTSRPHLPTMKKCREPWMGPNISIRGEIFPCTFVYARKDNLKTADSYVERYNNIPVKVPMKQFIMGDIFKDDFQKIWNGKEYRKLRAMILKSESMKRISREAYGKLRKHYNKEKKYSYCVVCQYKWGCSC